MRNEPQGSRVSGEILFSRTFKLAALGAAIAMISVTGSGAVTAQTYPAQPIKVVIGFVVAIFWTVVVIAAVLAVVWAVKTLVW